jgi:murein DD-endopeptidase MepM/ murein hydrolase activator NlpD
VQGVLRERAQQARAREAAEAAEAAAQAEALAAQETDSAQAAARAAAIAEAQARVAASAQESAASVTLLGALGLPVAGPITSPYGMRVHPITGVRKMHEGTDYGSACGTPIRAAAAGTVVQATALSGYGNQVVLDHGIFRGAALATSYSHQSRMAVSAGQQVSRGQVIGYIGSTGYSTGCHLHFMVYNATTTPSRTSTRPGWCSPAPR